MTVLKPQVIVAGSFTPQESRPEASANGVVIARVGRMTWTKRWAGIYIKNMPFTAVFPHKGQEEIRAYFGYKAHTRPDEYKSGLKDGLPPVAAYLKQEMKNKRAKHRKDPKEYPSKLRRTFNRAEDLAKKLGLPSLDQVVNLVETKQA